MPVLLQASMSSVPAGTVSFLPSTVRCYVSHKNRCSPFASFAPRIYRLSTSMAISVADSTLHCQLISNDARKRCLYQRTAPPPSRTGTALPSR